MLALILLFHLPIHPTTTTTTTTTIIIIIWKKSPITHASQTKKTPHEQTTIPLPPKKKKNTHHQHPIWQLQLQPDITCTKLRHCWCHCAFFMTLKVFPSNLWGQLGGHKPWQAHKASSASSPRGLGDPWCLGFLRLRRGTPFVSHVWKVSRTSGIEDENDHHGY